MHRSLKSRVSSAREGLVWVKFRREGRRILMIGVVYVNPEGLRVEEPERPFEAMEVDVMKFEGKGCDGGKGDFNARIGLGVEYLPNSNGKRLLDLVRLGDFVVGNKLQCCAGRWTGESVEKKSVIDYMLRKGLDVIKMVIEDSGNLDIGSDHNLIWDEVVWGRTEVKVRREQFKWRVDGRLVWEHYQEAVKEESIGWRR